MVQQCNRNGEGSVSTMRYKYSAFVVQFNTIGSFLLLCSYYSCLSSGYYVCQSLITGFRKSLNT